MTCRILGESSSLLPKARKIMITMVVTLKKMTTVSTSQALNPRCRPRLKKSNRVRWTRLSKSRVANTTPSPFRAALNKAAAKMGLPSRILSLENLSPVKRTKNPLAKARVT